MTTQQKRYDFASAQKVNDKAAFGAVSGFVAQDPKEEVTSNGKKVLRFSVPLNNTGKKITGAFGRDKAPETLWLNVSVWEGFMYDRALAAIKKGVRLLLSGPITEYVGNNGSPSYTMNLRDFTVLYSANEGRLKMNTEYSFASFGANQLETSGKEAFGVIQGVITGKPSVTMVAGRKALRLFVKLNKIGTKVFYPLGVEGKSPDEVKVSVVLFEPQSFERVDSVSKVLRDGTQVTLSGTMSLKPIESGGYYYNFLMNDFDVFAQTKEETNTQQENTNQGTNNQPSPSGHFGEQPEPHLNQDPFASYGVHDPFAGSSIDITDDDLPF